MHSQGWDYIDLPTAHLVGEKAQTFKSQVWMGHKLRQFKTLTLKGDIVTPSQGFAQIKVENLCKANIRDKIET